MRDVLMVLLAAFTAPMTQGELVRASGLSNATVCRHVRALRDADQAHVSTWRPNKATGGPAIAVYAPWPGIDAKDTLPRTTDMQRVRKYRAKRKIKQAGPWATACSLTAALYGRT